MLDSLARLHAPFLHLEEGVLYTDDRKCTARQCKLFLVALDLQTGREIARIRVKATKPSIGQILIGANNAIYFPATDTEEAHGYVTRVTARSRHSRKRNRS